MEDLLKAMDELNESFFNSESISTTSKANEPELEPNRQINSEDTSMTQQRMSSTNEDQKVEEGDYEVIVENEEHAVNEKKVDNEVNVEDEENFEKDENEEIDENEENEENVENPISLVEVNLVKDDKKIEPGPSKNKAQLVQEIQTKIGNHPTDSWPAHPFDKKFKIHCYIEDNRSTDLPKPITEWVKLENSGFESLCWKLQKLLTAYDDNNASSNLLANCAVEKTSEKKKLPDQPVQSNLCDPPKLLPKITRRQSNPNNQIKNIRMFEPVVQEPVKIQPGEPKREIKKLPPTSFAINLEGLLPPKTIKKSISLPTTEYIPEQHQSTLPAVPPSPKTPPELPAKKRFFQSKKK